MTRKALALITACVAVVLSSLPAAAYTPPPVNFRTTWPCARSTIYIDPAAPKDVRYAVIYWRRMFRPDWGYTRNRELAGLQVLMRKPDHPGASGLTTIYGNATTRSKAVVEIDPSPELASSHHMIALHELGHVAGLEHNDDTQFAVMSAFPLITRYSAFELGWMAAARWMCRP